MPTSALSAQTRHRRPFDDSSMGTITHETTVCSQRMQLLERDKYLVDLTLWLNAAVAGAGSIALVCGEAGIGKTSLLQEFSRQQRDARVLWGACDALFTPRPLAPMHDIARQTKGALLATIDSGASRDKIF